MTVENILCIPAVFVRNQTRRMPEMICFRPRCFLCYNFACVLMGRVFQFYHHVVLIAKRTTSWNCWCNPNNGVHLINTFK